MAHSMSCGLRHVRCIRRVHVFVSSQRVCSLSQTAIHIGTVYGRSFGVRWMRYPEHDDELIRDELYSIDC